MITAFSKKYPLKITNASADIIIMQQVTILDAKYVPIEYLLVKSVA